MRQSIYYSHFCFSIIRTKRLAAASSDCPKSQPGDQNLVLGAPSLAQPTALTNLTMACSRQDQRGGPKSKCISGFSLLWYLTYFSLPHSHLSVGRQDSGWIKWVKSCHQRKASMSGQLCWDCCEIKMSSNIYYYNMTIYQNNYILNLVIISSHRFKYKFYIYCYIITIMIHVCIIIAVKMDL